MTKTFNHKQCFDAFGVVPKNLRWSWSGRSDDGKVVAVTLWKNKFKEQAKVYDNFDMDIDDERRRPGYSEMMENLQHALDHTDGIVKVIAAIPVDPARKTWSIGECYPTKMVMRITHFDLETGRFALRAVA